ncbi:MAG: periplasmic heavy metal sensor [Ancalomicrobiaceae bacterium]|nr:periplasmic heavy metal sensor [Ancalomicrobiaceae bacterium]
MSESQSSSSPTPASDPSAGPSVPPPDARCHFQHRRGRCHRAGRFVILAVALSGSFVAGGIFLGHLHAQVASGVAPQSAIYQGAQPPAEAAAWFGEAQMGPEGPGGWMPMHGRFMPPPPPPMDPAERLAHAHYMFDLALTHVGVTSEQKTKVLAVFDDTAKTLEGLHGRVFTTRIDLAQILTADKVDRDRLEALRASRVGDIEQASKTIVKALGDIGDILTADQRIKLAMLLEHPPR